MSHRDRDSLHSGNRLQLLSVHRRSRKSAALTAAETESDVESAVTVQTSGGRTQCQEEKEDTSVMEFLYKTPTVQGSRW